MYLPLPAWFVSNTILWHIQCPGNNPSEIWFQSQSQSQKCFIAIQEKVYIDQINKTAAHSGLFVPLIW